MKVGDCEYSRHIYDLKGKRAEHILFELADRSFLSDWCYRNPHDERKKEICDLLVLFDETAIIYQLKDIKFSGNDERFVRKAIDDPIRQVLGAERTLFGKQTTVELTNTYNFTVQFDPKKVKRVYRIVGSVGQADIPRPFMEKRKGKLIHIFDHVLGLILTELDTITDFLGYLEEREWLYSSGVMVNVIGGEEELLADYLANEKSFHHHEGLDLVVFERGLWEEFCGRTEYRNKLQADRMSYAWDILISTLHESGDPDYIAVAREMARTDRLDRRILAKHFLSTQLGAGERQLKWGRCISQNGITYVFLAVPPGMSRIDRKYELSCRCFIARNLFRMNPRVVGVSCEWHGSPSYAYDCVLLDAEVWTPENIAHAERAQKSHGYFRGHPVSGGPTDEYPMSEVDSDPLAELRKFNRIVAESKEIPPNAPCPCGSGKKYKKCHGKLG